MHNVGKTNRIHDHLLRIIRISFPSPRRKAINQTGRAKSVLSEREGPRGGPGRKSRTRRESTISLFFPPKKQTTESILTICIPFLPCLSLHNVFSVAVRETRGRAKISARFLGEGGGKGMDLCTPATIGPVSSHTCLSNSLAYETLCTGT